MFWPILPIEREGKVVVAKIIVYAGEDEEYFSYTSKEALDALQSWLRYKEGSLEK
jgi:hypothetical protein